ncbi:MAG: Fic family protein [Desulfobacterales bacterium]
MPAFFDLLRDEPEPSVRVVLGHLVFVYVHPYMDGNGRIGRFLMNVMVAAGGYPWTVIPFDKRDDYMDALESGSVEQDIEPHAIFLGRLVSENLVSKQLPLAPTRLVGEK